MENITQQDRYHFCSLGVKATIIMVVVITLCWLAVKAVNNDNICRNSTNN